MSSSNASQAMMPSAQARRINLAAQGFGDEYSSVAVGDLGRVAGRLGAVQIDSVNVLCRGHYLTFFSRLGAYPADLLDAAATGSPRQLVEYWAHEASYMTPQTHRLLRWRMARAADEAWANVARTARERADLVEAVLAVVRAHGPLTGATAQTLVADDQPRAARGQWSSWNDVKRALAFLFWAGEISAAGRTGQFERLYDITARVLPADVLDLPDPEPEAARRELLSIAARALGVAGAKSLREYFRMKAPEGRVAIADLVATGELEPVTVEGSARPLYLHTDAAIPSTINARSLLGPFDSLLWDRAHTETVWGFRYKLEIYTPAAERVHGYYVLPLLLGEDLVGRVDLKAERGQASAALRVRAAWVEPGRDVPQVATELAHELRRLADWLALDDVIVEPVGDLASALAAVGP